jgi:hypothetical protein
MLDYRREHHQPSRMRRGEGTILQLKQLSITTKSRMAFITHVQCEHQVENNRSFAYLVLRKQLQRSVRQSEAHRKVPFLPCLVYRSIFDTHAHNLDKSWLLLQHESVTGINMILNAKQIIHLHKDVM